MKTKLLLVILLFCSGCSLLPGGPRSTVKKFMVGAKGQLYRRVTVNGS